MEDAAMGPGVVRRVSKVGAACLVFVAFAGSCLAAGQNQHEPKPKISDQPLTAEQLAIYQVVLHGWMNDGKAAVNLSIQTVPLHTDDPLGAGDCAKGLDMETASPMLHRFRKEDLPQLGSDKIGLVDPDAQSREVEKNDPENTMRRGASVDEAVRNAFAHGLVTLSEIQFDKQHLHAIVAFGFRCGGLCGNGGTVVMEKIDGQWKVKSQCDNWVS
jgi:hypothetical protein